DHYTAGESQKGMIYSYLLFLWYVRLDRSGVNILSYGFILCISGKDQIASRCMTAKQTEE
ncbi:hypothetical protein, partial [Porphyromonas gingivalis]|uniref:hypothetical protein n=1 Tax=Porphyromonas gingivalis TaxID=837 RepID=UPI001EE6D739